jgi:TPR repeat protein
MIISFVILREFCGVKRTKFWVPILCLAAALATDDAVWAAGPQPAPAPPAKTSGAPDPSAALKARDLPEAARQARLQAEEGSSEGQFNLALFFWHGVAVPQNYQEALRWITLSALADFPRAAAARAEMLKATDPSLAKSVMDWARTRLVKEAEAGDNRALVLLSNSFAPQFGFENPAESYYWALLAVTAGQVDAKRRRDALVSTLKPADVIKTQDKAADWYAKHRQGAAKNASAPKG